MFLGLDFQLKQQSCVLCRLSSTILIVVLTPIYACLLDLSKAFDLVHYDILWKKLTDIYMPEELVQIFQYWCLNQVNVVRWSNEVSEPYNLECGVSQQLTSPRLFNIYVNALIEELSSTHVGFYIDDICIDNIRYADDMVLLRV